MNRRRWIAVLPLLTQLGFAQESRPDETPASAPAADFLRFRTTGDDEGALEVAVARYRDAEGRTVDLVSAIHIADAAHYRDLQRLFEEYDALLYELIGPEGAKPRPGQRQDSVISLFQKFLQRGLGLAFQLEGIDYRQPNFVHADISASEFGTLTEERGEGFWRTLHRAYVSSMAQQAALARAADPDAPPFDMVSAVRRGEGLHLLRMTLARLFDTMELQMAAFEGVGEGGSVIIGARNERAIEVLQQQLAAGKRRLGIYYGAGHMPDLDRRLRALGFTLTDVRWLTAWDVSKARDAKRDPKSDGATSRPADK